MENFFVNVRKKIKTDLENFLNENPDMPIDKALAIFSLKTGYKVSTLRIYYDELKLAGLLGN